MSIKEAKQYEKFVKEAAPKVAEALDLRPRKLYVRLTDMIAVPALAHERTIFLNEKWFAEHPDDYGTIVHEITHAIMNISVAIEAEAWLIEGLADYVRDELGYAKYRGSLASYPFYKKGGATEGYQTTAHFLIWVKEKYGRSEVQNLARLVSQGKVLPLEKLEAWIKEYEVKGEL